METGIHCPVSVKDHYEYSCAELDSLTIPELKLQCPYSSSPLEY